MTTLEPTTNTAPDFAATPLAWALWHLTHHPELYREFRVAADRLVRANPTARISARMIVEHVRYNTLASAAHGDTYKANNNLTSLYARLYLLERPHARMETRGAWLDALTPTEQNTLLDAFLKALEEQTC